MLQPVQKGLDLDDGLRFIEPHVIIRVATISVSQQWLQGLG